MCSGSIVKGMDFVRNVVFFSLLRVAKSIPPRESTKYRRNGYQSSSSSSSCIIRAFDKRDVRRDEIEKATKKRKEKRTAAESSSERPALLENNKLSFTHQWTRRITRNYNITTRNTSLFSYVFFLFGVNLLPRFPLEWIHIIFGILKNLFFPSARGFGKIIDFLRGFFLLIARVSYYYYIVRLRCRRSGLRRKYVHHFVIRFFFESD